MCTAVVVIQFCNAAAPSKKRRSSAYDNSQYNYHYDNPHGDYSYSQKEYYDMPVEDRKCYTCEYTVFASLSDDPEGDPKCLDPFHGGVAEVECEHPCAVSLAICRVTIHTVVTAAMLEVYH